MQDIEHERRVRLIALLLLSLRGNLFVYQGEELGLTQSVVPYERLQDPEALTNWPHTMGRDGARTPMPWKHNGAHAGFSSVEPWLPIEKAHELLAVGEQESAPQSTLAHFRRLIAIRNDSAALRYGDLEFLDAPDGVLAFTRSYEGQKALCVFNLSGAAVEWRPSPAEGLEVLAGVGVSENAAAPASLEAASAYLMMSNND